MSFTSIREIKFSRNFRIYSNITEQATTNTKRIFRSYSLRHSRDLKKMNNHTAFWCEKGEIKLKIKKKRFLGSDSKYFVPLVRESCLAILLLVQQHCDSYLMKSSTVRGG